MGVATNYVTGDTEWSATGRLCVSLAGLAGLNDATFAEQRAAERDAGRRLRLGGVS